MSPAYDLVDGKTTLVDLDNLLTLLGAPTHDRAEGRLGRRLTTGERVFTCKPCADRNEECPHARNCPSIKPHGRRAWSIYLSEKLAGPYVDVSVMPRAAVVVDNEGGAG